MIGMVLMFLGAFLSFSLYCAICYMNWKSTAWYMFWGLAASLIGNVFWLSIAAKLAPKARYVAGLGFDMLVVVAFLIIPALFYGIKFSKLGWVGIGLAVLGLVIAKIGG